MKFRFLLLAVLPIALAADCVCPQVKCPADEPAVRISPFSTVPVLKLIHGLTLPKLCKCLNSAALACHKKCGGPPPRPKGSSIIFFPFPIFKAPKKLIVHDRDALNQLAAQPVWHLRPLPLSAAAAAFLLALTAPTASTILASQAAISQPTAPASASYQTLQPL